VFRGLTQDVSGWFVNALIIWKLESEFLNREWTRRDANLNPFFTTDEHRWTRMLIDVRGREGLASLPSDHGRIQFDYRSVPLFALIRTAISGNRVFSARFSYAARRVSWGVEAALAARSAVMAVRALGVTW
jgi:hypothetical protein